MTKNPSFGKQIVDFVKADEDFVHGQISVGRLRDFFKKTGDDPLAVKTPLEYILYKDTERRYLLRATKVLDDHAARFRTGDSLSAKWQPQWSDERPQYRDQATSPTCPGRLKIAGRASLNASRRSGSANSKDASKDVTESVLQGRIQRRQRTWPRLLSDTREKGLMNRGNMCYRNSILSCLLHQPTIYHYLKNVDHQCAKPRQECTMCALQHLMTQYWSRRRDGYSVVSGPRKARQELDQALRSDLEPDDPMADDIRQERQSDAFDIAQHMIHKLGQEEGPNSKICIGDLFNLNLERQWTCQTCGQISASGPSAPFAAGLSLRIDAPERYLELEEYIKYYLETNELRRCDSAACRQKYQSDHMGRDVSGQKRRSAEAHHPGFEREVIEAITTVPELLLIKLDRARAVFKSPRTGRLLKKAIEYKMDEDVPFKERLDLTRYRSDGAEEKLIYRLDGVSAHAGQLGGGHYIAVVREWNQQHNGTTFWTINDNVSVEPSESFSAMQEPFSLEQRFSPFVLLYSRVHPGERGYEDDGSLGGGEE